MVESLLVERYLLIISIYLIFITFISVSNSYGEQSSELFSAHNASGNSRLTAGTFSVTEARVLGSSIEEALVGQPSVISLCCIIGVCNGRLVSNNIVEACLIHDGHDRLDVLG